MSTAHKLMRQASYLIPILFFSLTACGDKAPLLVNTDAVPDGLNVYISQNNSSPWSATFGKAADQSVDELPLDETIALHFLAQQDGHTLFIPELGISLLDLEGHIAQSWTKVSKPVSVKVQCEQHPQEDTGLTLTFK